jgi:transposase
LEPKAQALNRLSTLARLEATLATCEGIVAQLASELVVRCLELTRRITELKHEIAVRVSALAPNLLAICGCGFLTAAKLLGETAGIERFHSADAYARHNGTAPLAVSSAGVQRHRLSRAGNRQLNAALYRIALTQSRWDPRGKALIARRREQGDSSREALRVLKRRLSDVVYRALRADAEVQLETAA